MLDAAEDWLGRRGMTRVIAPFNGVAFLGMSALTDAYEESPMFPMPWSPPYYEQYFADAGYEHAYPFWFYEVDFMYERYRDFTQRALESPECTRARGRQGPLGRRGGDAARGLERGLRDRVGVPAVHAGEFREFFKDMKPVVDSRTPADRGGGRRARGARAGDARPHPAWRAMRGRLGPLKLLRMLRSARRPSRVGLLGIAVRPQFRGRRIGATLASSLYRSLEAMGLRKSNYYPVNDSNVQSRGLAESLGGEGRILFHCFDKDSR